jgi:hypothetical protein
MSVHKQLDEERSRLTVLCVTKSAKRCLAR